MKNAANRVQIFVFGSRLREIHRARSALEAQKNDRAIDGEGAGLGENSYPIPTMSETGEALSLRAVRSYVSEFLTFAGENPNLDFNVTKTGFGLAGLEDDGILPMFRYCPANVRLPKDWAEKLFPEPIL
jgi:hypothetical protein